MQAQLTASARVAKTSRAFQQLNTGSKNRALFLLGVLELVFGVAIPVKPLQGFFYVLGNGEHGRSWVVIISNT